MSGVGSTAGASSEELSEKSACAVRRNRPRRICAQGANSHVEIFSARPVKGICDESRPNAERKSWCVAAWYSQESAESEEIERTFRPSVIESVSIREKSSSSELPEKP